MNIVGKVVHELNGPHAADTEFSIFSPRVSIDPRANEFMALLPLKDINQLCLEHLSALPASAAANHYIGLFAADPFRRMIDLFAAIERVRPLGIANYPTVGLYQGELRTSMTNAGYSVEAELSLLRTARERGMRAAAFVTSAEDGEMALDMGADLMVVHPGLDSCDMTAAQIEATRTLVTALSAKSIRSHSRVLLYLPAASLDRMAPAAEAANGVILYPASALSP